MSLPQGGQDGVCTGRPHRTTWAHGRHQPGAQEEESQEGAAGEIQGLWPRLLFPILGQTSVALDFQKIVYQLTPFADYRLRQNRLFSLPNGFYVLIFFCLSNLVNIFDGKTK